VKEIVSEGEIAVDAQGAGGRRPLHRAAGGNHVKVVTYLVSKGAKPESVDKSGRTALHWAAISGAVEATEYLIGVNSNILAASSSMMTPLHGACSKGHLGVIRVLLAGCGDFMEQACTSLDEDGKTPCQLAIEEGHDDCVALLKELGDPVALAVPEGNSGYISTPDDATCMQRFRDNYINARTSKPWLALDLLYILAVIVDGAFFFFLLVGWTSMESDDRDCWLNWSIQVLCGLFSYPSIIEIPWRFANLVHLCSANSGEGLDFYGKKTDKIWFHLSTGSRLFITVLLILNMAFQWVNQWSRIKWNDFESSNEMPGLLYTNVFFGASFVCGIGGAVYQAVCESKKRRETPGKFPGPFDAFRSASGSEVSASSPISKGTRV
jgi:hypothetical protein